MQSNIHFIITSKFIYLETTASHLLEGENHVLNVIIKNIMLLLKFMR